MFIILELAIFKLVLLACNLTKQFNTSLNNLRWPYWLGVNYGRSAFMHYLFAWMERKAGCENHLRLWTRMLDLLCTILIFKHNHPVISWWFPYAYCLMNYFLYSRSNVFIHESVEYILQCEIRLTHCIFINWKDFSSFLCQLQHMHRGVLT